MDSIKEFLADMLIHLLNLWQFLKGKKTFIVCIMTVAYAAFGYWKGFITGEQAFQLLSTAGIGAGIRGAKN